MALTDNTKLDKSFKTLISKEFSTTGKAFYSEFGANTININSGEVWAENIPSVPDDAVSNGIARKLTQFVLSPVAGFTTSVFYVVSGSGFTPGTTIDRAAIDTNLLQRNFISDKYGTAYNIQLFDNTGNEIFALDNIDWFFDYVTGILFIQDPNQGPGNTTYPMPFKITAYQYIGKTLSSDTLNYSGSFSGSFQGNGTGLTNVPASGIVGLNLTQIADSQVSASVSATGTSFTVTSASVDLLTVDNQGLITANNFTGSFEGIGSGSFSGSFQGNGDGLTDIPASSIVGLNLSLVSTGSVTASTAPEGTVFRITSASVDLLTLDNLGNLVVSGSEVIGNHVTAKGNATITGSLTVNGATTLNDSLFVTNAFIVNNSSSLKNTTITGSLLVTQNFTVLGTASFTRVTGSEIIIGSPTITLNTDSPVVRFGGMVVQDSGSFGLNSTSSFLYDSEKNQWLFQHEGAGEQTGSSIAIFGPLNEGNLGDELGLAEYTIPRTYTDHGHHIGNSNIYSTGSNVTINKGATGSIDGVEILGAVVITGSTLLPSPDGAVSNKYALVTSQSAWHYSDNVGYPAGTNQWNSGLNGSYFNIFTPNTDTATILRFVAGLLSSSAPAPSPNTRTYNTVTAGEDSLGSTSTVSVLSDQRLSLGYTSSAQISQAFKNTINYGIAKGWSATGSENNGEGTQPWKLAGAAYYQNFSTYNFRFTSNASSGTGGNGSDFFGLDAFVPTEQDFKVRLIGSMSFSDTASITSPNASTGTVTQTKTLDFLKTRGTTTPDGNGLSLATIITANPAVIPNTFQDARFFEAGKVAFLTRSFGTSLVADNTVSSSGYYNFYGMQAGVTSGSSTSYIFKTTSNISRLWLPITAIQTSMSATPSTITATGTVVVSSSLAPSRSLSGAPYLTVGTSTWTYSTTASGIFDPAYRADTIFNQTVTENITGTVNITSNIVALNAAGITTSGKVYDAAGNVKNSGLPRINDVIRSTANVTHTIASGDSNIAQTGIGTINFNLATSGVSYNASSTPLDSRNIPYYQSGSYVQPITSGTLAIYGQVQGYDGGTYSLSSGNLVVNFTGESRRLQFTDKLLSGSYALGDAWSTAFGLYNLGTSDLQIKPGFLVKPTGSGGYGYWLNDPDTSGTAANLKKKYAAFGFTRNTTGNQPNITMTLAGNTSLSAWTVENPDTISILIVPQSVLATVTQASGIDPVAAATTTAIGAGTATNPFGRTLTVLANSNPQKTNPFIVDFPTSPNPFPLNGTYQNFVVLVRYIGNPVPLTSITLAVS